MNNPNQHLTTKSLTQLKSAWANTALEDKRNAIAALALASTCGFFTVLYSTPPANPAFMGIVLILATAGMLSTAFALASLNAMRMCMAEERRAWAILRVRIAKEVPK